MTITEIQKAYEDNTLTVYGVTKYFMERISAIDNGEIKYNSVLEVNPDALFEAQKCDFERSKGKNKGYLHGIPVLLKDNINTVGKMHTTAGALAFKTHYANEDASIVTTLKEAGAIILGKTNLTELACFMTLKNRNGYSSHGGQVLCPWNIDEDPSGSSTGSAVSMSLGLAPFAIGTETGGSIMSPSRKNGIVGLKPTIGFISRNGIIPISSTLDTAGPMARNVSDIAIALSGLRDFDKKDPITYTKETSFKDYTNYLNPDGAKNKKIGVILNDYDKLNDKEQSLFNNMLLTLEKNGATIDKDVKIEEPKKIFQIMLYEFKSNFNAFLKQNDMPITSLASLIRYNRDNEKEALKYGQILLEEVESNTSGRLNEKEYIDALSERKHKSDELKDLFKSYDMLIFANYTSLGPECGFPSMTLPLGLDKDSMPVGTYFLANKFHEHNLIEIGYSLEQALNVNLDPLQK
jgi:amidase